MELALSRFALKPLALGQAWAVVAAHNARRIAEAE